MKKNVVKATVNRAADNSKNNFASHKRAVKIDLSTVVEIMANKTNGYISEDLYEALKMVEAAGLGSVDKPLPEFIPTEKRELNYDEIPLSKEADLVLLLRAKAGDNEAVTKLFLAKKTLIEQITWKMFHQYAGEGYALEREFDYYEAVAYEAFCLCLIQHPVCFPDDIMFSHLKYSYALSEILPAQFSYSTKMPSAGTKCVTSDIKKQMKKEGFDTCNLTEKQYLDFCTSRKICSESVARKAYANYWASNNDYDDDVFVLDSFEDKKASEKMDNVIDFVDAASYKSDFVSIIMKLREDEKYGRDVETLITHVLGEKGFNFDSLYAEKAEDRESLARTAEIMGYESEYEVKLAMKRAKEFIFKNIKRNNPELFAALTADRKVSKVK